METFSSPRKVLHYLQVARFAAASLVLLGHAQHEVDDLALGRGNEFHAFTPLDWGIGVDIFFIVSGFIMYYLTSERFGRPGEATQFLTRRIIRIVPLYWFFSLAMLAAMLLIPSMLAHHQLDVMHVVSSFMFIPWPRDDGRVSPILALGWTLNYEMMFYLVFAFALTKQRANALVSIVLIFCILIVARSIAPEWMGAVRFWGDPIILEFLIGVLIASWYLNGLRLPGAARLAMVGAGIIAAVAMHYAAIPLDYRVLTHGIPAFLVIAAAVLGNEPSRIGYVGWLLRFGGDASYALYLSHPFSINLFALLWKRIIADAPWAFVAGASAFSLVVAACVFSLVEMPILKSLNELASRRSTNGVAAKP